MNIQFRVCVIQLKPQTRECDIGLCNTVQRYIEIKEDKFSRAANRSLMATFNLNRKHESLARLFEAFFNELLSDTSDKKYLVISTKVQNFRCT